MQGTGSTREREPSGIRWILKPESCICADRTTRPCGCRATLLVVISLVFLTWPGAVGAQEIEPRTYSNTPVGMNFLALVYSYSSGNVFMDPALPIEDVDAQVHLALGRYIRTFGLFGKPAKFKALVPWSDGHWDGFLEGEFRTRDARGLADPRLGLDVLLSGAPALDATDFRGYEQDLVVGLRFDLVTPWGEYDSTKLINLGSNRWAFHSEVGVSKAVGKWTLEGAGGVWLYTDNNDFFGGNTFAQDPFFVVKANVVRAVRPGFWWAVGMGYGQGGQTFVNGEPRNTKQKNWRFTAMVVFPISPTQGLSLTAASGRTFQAGPDFDVIAVAYQFAWGGR